MNDPITVCPRCNEKFCFCVERDIADALKDVATGVINIDVLAGARWVSSMRKHERTAFIEFKRATEVMREGQSKTLVDLTGQLWTAENSFHQRSFIIWQVNSEAFNLFSFFPQEPLGKMRSFAILRRGSIRDCVLIIQRWMDIGSLPQPLERSDS